MVKVKDTFTPALTQRAAAIAEQADQSAKEAAHTIMEDAIARAPIDTGELKESGWINRVAAGRYTYGFSADHAIYVHEDTSAHHDTGEAKFLRNAISAYGGSGARNTLQQLRRAAARGEITNARIKDTVADES